MIKASDLVKEQKERDTIKFKTFDKIYILIEKKIVLASKGNNYHTWFDVPEFLVGYPLYNMEDCLKYITEKLKKNGFKSEFFNPNILYIKWF